MRFDGLLLASDIDGTLITDELVLPAANEPAVRRLQSGGGFFTIATGRSIAAARRWAALIAPNAPCVVLNGAAIYDYRSDEMVYQIGVPAAARPATREVIARFPKISAEIHIGDDVYAFNENARSDHHLRTNPLLRPHRVPFDDVPQDWHKVLFAGETADLRPLQRWAKANTPAGSYFISTSDVYFELLNEAATKGNALKKLAALLGVADDGICAIGDYYNDVALLHAAKHTALAGNAPPELWPMADYIACRCEDGAVADYIDYLGRL